MAEAGPGADFLDSLWPGAAGIADPDKRLYQDFQVGRGGVSEMFGPSSVACGIRATAKGNFIGRKQGDPWTLPTFVLVDGDQILWRHDGSHAGDHPRWLDIMERGNV